MVAAAEVQSVQLRGRSVKPGFAPQRRVACAADSNSGEIGEIAPGLFIHEGASRTPEVTSDIDHPGAPPDPDPQEWPADGQSTRQAAISQRIHSVFVDAPSRDVTEVEEVCDRVLFLSRGRILLEGSPRASPRDHGKETLDDRFVSVAREPFSAGGG